MTDLEIDKALALAIGHTPGKIIDEDDGIYVAVPHPTVGEDFPWVRKFDYRDWNVIGPIAEKYLAWPGNERTTDGMYSADGWETEADTPQKAIAMAVIQGGVK